MFFFSQSCTANPATVVSPATPTVTATGILTTTRTPRSAVAVTSTPNDVATLYAIATASIKTLISTVEPFTLASYASSDGNWEAEVIRYDCINYQYPDYIERIAYEQLKLKNLVEEIEKIIEDQLQNCDGVGGGGLKGLYWSSSNRYFYSTDWREGYPKSCGNYVVPMIYRFDTLTEQTTTLGGGHVSPDQTKLAMWQENKIVIWDLDRGEVGRLQSLESVRFNGEISWSPDSKSIVYLQTEWDCAPDCGKTYLTRLNLVEMSQELLIESESPGFGRVSWDAMNQITLWDGYNKEWRYNLIDRELKAIP